MWSAVLEAYDVIMSKLAIDDEIEHGEVAVTLGTGRTHMMKGTVHLVIFAVFLFLVVVS